ncbi:hypothetical protein SmJEL517_g03358 [Synchytrium microbalum]|uniref:Uncharacterized protein n=1 Tax=Synchytrium microbalum TaxID=1806994 RepID=A0A507C453_9FUNG|nr:uncharacterized protein SmJEL517_g03358 [Synchytrium microbalum]TPX33869.1 hypothetical protein SmJEL517_g03358 [Synchytrium microbalum]
MPIIDALIHRGFIIHIVTNAPAFLFDSALKWTHQCHLRPLIVDVGVIQSDAITLDRTKTMDALEGFMKTDSEWICTETQWLQQNDISMILLDAPFLPALAAKAINIPAVVVSNFTFDSMYSSLCELPTPKETKILESVYLAYAATTNLIQLPGEVDIPAFTKRDGLVYKVPLVVRHSTKRRDVLRAELGIPIDAQVLLICFGGHELLVGSWSPDTVLPDDTWYGLVVGWNSKNSTSRLKSVGQNVFMPDLINCSDVVLGKAGYGLCSEVVAHNKPLLYIKRSGWAEESGLINMMNSYGHAVQMEYADFTAGRWKHTILKAVELNQTSPRGHLHTDGADKVVEVIEGLMKI